VANTRLFQNVAEALTTVGRFDPDAFRFAQKPIDSIVCPAPSTCPQDWDACTVI
jgi:hypothetical protein